MPRPDYIGPTTPGNVNLVTAFSNALSNSVSLDPLSNLYGSGCVPSGCLPVPGAWMPPFEISSDGLNYSLSVAEALANPGPVDGASLPLIGGSSVSITTYLSDPSSYEIDMNGTVEGGISWGGFASCADMYAEIDVFKSNYKTMTTSWAGFWFTYTNTNGQYIMIDGNQCPDDKVNEIAQLSPNSSGIVAGYSGDYVQSTWEAIL